MRFLWFIVSVILINLQFIVSTVTQTSQDEHQPFLYTVCFPNMGNYTTNSIYNTNLNRLLSSLPSSNNGFGFYNSSTGQNPNKAYAIGLCRGDITPDDCGICLSDVRSLLIQACPFQKEAIGWYQNCMLRFSNRSLHGSLEVLPAFSLWNAENVLPTDMDAFNRKRRNLLKSLRSEAAAGGDLRKFATGSARVRVAPKSMQTIYALVQCTPDLSEMDCKRCLLEAFGYIPKCCYGKDTGRLVKPSCNLRFELSLFFNSPAAPQPLTVSDSPLPLSDNTKNIPQAGTKSETLWIIIAIAVAAIVGVMVLIICYHHFLRVNTNEERVGRSQILPTPSFNGTEINFDTVKSSTDDFAEANKLGEGGFGSVYKGYLNGQYIAVKRLSMEHGQGDVEFSTEVSFLVLLRHQNLVKLLGFSVEGNERLLVYEFIPNTSLDNFIFDPDRRSHLDWDRRDKIIVGIARGLLYLHDNPSLRIIHRDLKASNILLDADLNPKIADFGMARLFTDGQMQQHTSRVVGTRGYMAPEYITGGIFSVKSDVYSFGVMILEMASGEKNSNFRYEVNGVGLVSYAWIKWRARETSELIDPMLTGSRIKVMRCIKIGLLCVQDNEANRPTMGEVVDMLTTSNPATDTLPDPVPPVPPEQVVFDIGSSEVSNNVVTVPVPVPPQVPVMVSTASTVVESERTRLEQSSISNSSFAPVPDLPQVPAINSANSNSDSGIVSVAASPQTESGMASEGIRSNHVSIADNEAYSMLGKLFIAPFSVTSTVCGFLRGLVNWNNEARIRRRARTRPKIRPMNRFKRLWFGN